MTHANEMERRLEEATALAPQLTIEQRQRLLALGDDLEPLWDDPRCPANLKKRIPAHGTGGSDRRHDGRSSFRASQTAQLTVPKNKTGYHNHINSHEGTELIRELALAVNTLRLFLF